MNVMDAARNVAEDYPGGATALALRIDKNATTLQHELNETGTAKLGLVTAVKMSKRTRDLRILNAFAAEMGALVYLLPDSMLDGSNDDAMHLLSKLAGEFNDVVQSFVHTTADGKVTGNELQALRRQWSELQVVGQRVVAYAEALHEAGKPPSLRVVDGQQ